MTSCLSTLEGPVLYTSVVKLIAIHDIVIISTIMSLSYINCQSKCTQVE